MSKQILFFATRSDLTDAVKSIEDVRPLNYVRCIMSDQPSYRAYRALHEVEDLGKTSAKSYIAGHAYLVMEIESNVRTENVPQRNGGTKFIIDQKLNADSVVLRPGGFYDDRRLVCGSCGTASESKGSAALYADYSRCLVKAFKRIKAYYVGPEACQFLRAGVRLITMHIGEDPEYDLTE